MKNLSLHFLLLVLILTNSCKKKDSPPEPAPPVVEEVKTNCRISKVISENSPGLVFEYIYNADGKVIKTQTTGTTENVVTYYEYSGNQIKVISYYEEGKDNSGNDIWRSKYDSQGRLIEFIYTYGGVRNDCTVYDYSNQNQILKTKYGNHSQIKDTIIYITDIDVTGRIYTTYINKYYGLDTMLLYEQREYLGNEVPVSYNIDPTGDQFNNKYLSSKYTLYSYSGMYPNLVRTSNSEIYGYEFDSEGKVSYQTLNSTFGGAGGYSAKSKIDYECF